MDTRNLLEFGSVVQERFEADDPTVGVKALEAGNVGTVQRQLQALGRGDMDGFLAEVHPDIELDIFVPPQFDFIRHARGIDEFRRAVQHNFESLAEQRSEFLSLVAQGNIVGVVGRERGKLRDSGKPYDLHFAYQFTLRDSKVARPWNWRRSRVDRHGRFAGQPRTRNQND